jgi:hypothetical protein
MITSLVVNVSATGTLPNIEINKSSKHVVSQPCRLLLISSDIDQSRTIENEPYLLGQAVNDNTLALVYDAKTETLKTIMQRIDRVMLDHAITEFESVAFATHGGKNGFCITHEACVSDVTLYQPLLNEFWSRLSQYTSKQFDLMGCFLGKNERLLSKLSQQTDRIITASTNITGSVEKNGDWFLEIGGVDLEQNYFDKNLLHSIKTIALNPGDFNSTAVDENVAGASAGALMSDGSHAPVFQDSGTNTSSDNKWYIYEQFPNNFYSIQTNVAIDYETYAGGSGSQVYTITIDGTPYPVTPTVSNVLEIANQSMSITESASNGEQVGIIYISESDYQDFTPTFSITGGNTNIVFALENPLAGTIVVNDASKLDYETIDNYNLTVQVANGTYTETANISISVNNVNDSPVVTDPQSFDVNENTANNTPVGNLEVLDKYDYSLTYAITSGNDFGTFTITSAGGVIKVSNTSALNYENIQSYTLIVTVAGGEYDPTATVNISVIDVNEDPAIANQNFSITENTTAGTFAYTVLATDPENDTLTYIIDGGNTGNAFAISETTGALWVAGANLDYENIPEYNLSIAVTTGSVTETANVTISLINLDDSPVIADQSFDIDENANVGTTVGTVVVTKAYENTLSYSITNGNLNNAFSITSDTGIIKVNNKSALNYESMDAYTLVVTVSGGEYDPTATVVVNINNVNESPLMNNQSFSIAENTTSDTFAYSVNASDPESDQLTYTITGGNTGNAFAISETTGAIYVAGSLNYESQDTYDLILAVKDGEYTKTATISVTITDENDPPSLNNQTMTVNENSPNNTLIGSALTASDPDATDVTLTYSITGGSGTDALRISTDGQVSVKSSTLLNYEGGTISYTIIVQVADPSGLTDTALVTVNINNVNESPTITAQSASITENSVNGTTVYTVTASDPDNTYSPYTNNVFSITGGSGSTGFTINSAGVIYVSDNSLLNYESQQTLLLIVRVEDSSDSGLAASETVTITLTNINDNTPVITSQTYSVGKYSTNGVKAAPDNVPLATDADGDSLTYSITSGNTNGALTIVNGYFVIANADQFENESTPSYFIGISVTDGSNTATKNVRVNVENYPPSISADNDTTTVGTAQTLTITVNDSNGDFLTVVAFSSNVLLLPNDDTHLIVGGEGLLYTLYVENSPEEIPLTYLPLNQAGTATISLTATDASGATGVDNFTITISDNTAPQIGPVSDKTFDLLNVPQTFNFTIADSRSERLTITVGSDDNSVLAIGDNTTSISNSGDTYSFNIGETEQSLSLKITPTTVGSAIVMLTVTDQGGLTDSSSCTISVVSTPEIGEVLGTKTFDEDAGAQALKFTVVDADGNALTISYVSDNTSLFATESISFSGTNVNNSTKVISSASSESWITITVISTAESSGNCSITITITDPTMRSSTQSFSLTVNTVNDPPTITIPTSISTDEETEKVLSSGDAISISDVDAASDSVEVTLTSTGGIMTLSITTGLNNFSGSNGSALMNFEGSLTDINTALNGISFSPTTDFSGMASIIIDVNDLGNNGPDGAKTDTDTLTITVNSINDAPEIYEPSAQSTNEDEDIVFSTSNANAISITDVDAGSNSIQTTITVSNGTVTLAQSSGLTIHTGTNPGASMTFTSTVADVNAALDGMTFEPTEDYHGSASIVIEVDDGGNSGSGGILSDSATVSIAITSVNDTPVIGNIANQTTNESTATSPISFTVTDVEGGMLTITCSSSDTSLISSTGFDMAQTNGDVYTFTLSAGNIEQLSMTIMPALTQTGTSTISVTVTDAEHAFSSTTFILTVNDIPSITVLDDQSTDEDTATSPQAFTITDTDTNDIQMTVQSSNTDLVALSDIGFTSTETIVSSGNIYTVTLSSNTAVVFIQVTPTTNFSGSSVFTITVSDGRGSNCENYTVTVLSIPDPPTLTSISDDAIDEDESVSYTFTVSDADGGEVTVTCSSTSVTLVSSNELNLSETNTPEAEVLLTGGVGRDLTITISPIAGQSGTTTISLTVTDATGLSNVVSFELTVNAVPDAPTISSLSDDTINEDGSQSYTFTVSDADGGDLTVTCSSSALTLVSSYSLNLSETETSEVNLITVSGIGRDLTLTITPEADQSGTTTISLTVTDASGLSNVVSFELTVSPLEDAPQISSIQDETLDEDETQSYTFTVSDADGGDLTVTCSSSALTLVSTSGLNLSETNSEETELSIQASESRELTLTIEPLSDQYGTTTITLTVTDASGLSSVTTFDITYNASPDAPVITSTSIGTTSEDTEVSYTLTISDADGGEVTVTCSSSALTLVSESGLNLSETGLAEAKVVLLSKVSRELTLTINPESGKNGVTTLSLTVTDASGLSMVTTLELTVNSVEDAPTISTISPDTINEDSPKSYTFTISDADGGELTVTCSSTELTLVAGTGFDLSETGTSTATLSILSGEVRELTLTLSPVLNAFGTGTIQLTVTDATGLSAVTSFALTVNALPDAPTLTSISDDAIDEDESVSYTFTVSDADGGDVTVTCSSTSVTLVSSNELNLSETNTPEAEVLLTGGVGRDLTITISPIAGQSGTTTISLTVTDATGLSNVVSFELTVNAVPDAPTISSLSDDTINEDGSQSYTFTVSDADGGDLTVTCSSSALTLVSSYSLNLSETETSEVNLITVSGIGRDLTLTITPEADQSGTTTISLTVTDASGLSNVVSFELTVSPLEDAPQISSIQDETLDEDETQSYTFTVSDADGGDLTVTCSSSALTLVSTSGLNLSETNSEETELSIQASESRELTLTIEPLSDQYGTTTITLTVTDASGLSSVTTFDITVLSVNDAPTISTINNISTKEESPITPTTFTVADVDGDTLSITVTSSNNILVPSDSASITLSNASIESGYTLSTAPGTITLTILPALNQSGIAEITVTVSDGVALAITSFTLTVENQNDAPMISTIEDQTTNEDTTISSIAFAVTDVDQGDLKISATTSDPSMVAIGNISFTSTKTIVSSNNQYTVTLDPNITANVFMTITPTSNVDGSSTITVTVHDGNESDTSSFVLTINAMNDAPTITLPPGVLTTKEGTSFTIANLSIGDTDAASYPVQVTLTTGAPCIMILSTESNITIVSGENNSEAMTISGTVSNINTALNGLTYSPGTAIGSNTITVVVNDLGNTGDGSAQSVSGVVRIDITDNNVGPTITANTTMSVNEDNPLQITPVSVYDPDAGSEALQFTIVTAGEAWLTLSNHSNISKVSGQYAASQYMAFTGSQSDINLALDSLTLTTTTHFNGNVMITLTTNDMGHTGEDNKSYTDTHTIIVTVNAVNDAPINTLPSSLTTTEDFSTSFSASVADVDVDSYSVSVILSTNAGMLKLTDTTGLNGYDGTASNSIQFTGTLTNVNAAMATITFTPTTNLFGTYTITMTTNDLGYTGLLGIQTDTDYMALTITGLNDAPTIAVPAGLTTNEDTALSLTATVSDVDAASYSMIVTLVAKNGNMTITETNGLSVDPSVADVQALTLTGALTDINAALDSLTFTPTTNYYGDAGITLTVNDQGYAINDGQQGTVKSAQEYITITVESVNDAPEFTLSANTISENEDFSTPKTITVTATMIGNETESVTYSISPTPVNFANVVIDSRTGDITITSKADENGYSQITVIADDHQISNNSYTQTFDLTVLAINDAPSFTLNLTQINAIEDFSETYTINVNTGNIPADESSQSVTYSITPSVNWVNVSINASSGHIRITAVNDASSGGSQTFTVTANDGQTEYSTATQTFALTVTDINDPPTFTINTNAISVDEDFTTTQQIVVTPDTPSIGEESQEVTYTLTPSSVTWASVAIDPSSGTVTITNIPDAHGMTEFIITASDGQSEFYTATKSFALTVLAVNDPPSFTMSTNSVDESEDFTQTVNITITIGDVPADESTDITFTISPDPSSITWANISIDKASGEISITPVTDGNGITSFVITADDGANEHSLATSTLALTITAINDAPAFTLSTNDLTLNEDFSTTENITVTPGAVPEDESSAVTYSMNPSSLTWVNMSINTSTGAISITDVEDGHGSQMVTVTADDGGSANATYTQSFTITVNSINDVPSITSSASFSVSENTAVGTIVHTVTSTDADGDSCTYSITTIDPATPASFAITQSTGEIWIENNISYETHSTYTLTVSVSDSLSADTQQIIATIDDINDAPELVNVPINQQTTNKNVALTITTIQVTDDDAFSNDIQLTLTAENGVVSITGTGLTLENGNYSTTVLSVSGTITAINDALTIVAFNPDTDYSGSASVTITINDLGNTGPGNAQSVTGLIRIYVVDNNQAPTISGLSGSVTLDEDLSLTKTIIVTDDDAADEPIQFTLIFSNGSLTLSSLTGLNQVTTTSQLISYTGSVSSINAALDGIVFDPISEFSGRAGYTLLVNDLGMLGTGGPLSASPASITITYNAINDVPVNGVPSSLTISEDSPVSLTFTVSDNDAYTNDIHVSLTALNGTMTLSNTTGLSFAVNDGIADASLSFTGTMAEINTAMNTMSFSPTADFNGNAGITITTSDLGNSIPDTITSAQTDTDFLTITVNNVNDEPAITSTAVLTATEDILYTYTIQVSDADEPDTIVITASYPSFLSFTDNGDRSATLTGTPGNSDAPADESITITVTDGQLNVTQTYTLTVFNVNDAPEISSINDDSTDEDTAISISFAVTDIESNALTITVFSSDQTKVNADAISISSVSGASYTIVAGAISHGLTLAIDPLADTNGTVTLTVLVTDSGAMTANTSFVLTINSINDTPTITGNTFSISENSLTGTSVGTINISDVDIEDTLIVTITDGNEDSAFAINNSGGITVNDGSMLNFESTSSYTLTVEVSDSTLSATALVYISLSDVNEHPEVSSINDISTDEDSTVSMSMSVTDVDMNSLTIAVSSSDEDIVNGNAISISGTTGGNYTIPSGSLSTALTLTITPLADTNGAVTLTVLVTDSGALTAQTSFVLTVNPVNDTPTITGGTFSITENSATNSSVITLTVADVDEDDLEVTITDGNTGSAFAINNSGSITVNDGSQLDFETNSSYTLTVQVSDSLLTATAQVNINVIDVNEAPEISDQTFDIDEDASNGDTVDQVIATDQDASTTLAYSITGGNSDNIFDIDNNGNILIDDNTNMDHETTDSYNLTVEVSDGSLSASSTITVTINDVNESPTITGDTFSLPENSDNGTAVGSITINDEDEGDVPTVTITSGDDNFAFSIDDNGDITVNDKTYLDYETKTSFTLTVQANDGEFSPTDTVTINITNVNEAPVIADKSFTIDENTSNETSVGSVSYSDVDADSNLTLDITSGNTNNAFAIDNNGNISVNNSSALNYESQSSFTLTVEVTDGELDDTAQITIDLNDVNEAPVMSAIDNQEIFEDHPTPAIIINLSDEDTDDLEITVETSDLISFPSSSLTFTDEGGPQNAGYTCSGEDNINISLVILPPLNVNGSFDITLTVSDTQLEDTVHFSIAITPVNDMPLFTLGTPPEVDEDEPTQFINDWITGISAGAADETESLTFIMSTDNEDIFTSEPYVEISGTTAKLVFTPLENAHGKAIVTISLTDGYSTTANRSFGITINSVNDSPSFTAGDNQIVVGNIGNMQIVENWATNIYLGPPDELDEQSAIFIIDVEKTELFESGPIVTSNGTLKYTPIEKAYGVSEIYVTLSDGGDGAYTGGIETFTIDISSINSQPSFSAGNNITALEDSGYNLFAGWATAITTGHKDESEQSIEFSITATNAGIFSVPPSIQYTKGNTTADLIFNTEWNTNGTSTLYITMKDSGGTVQGGIDTYTVQTMTITIEPVNDAPSFVKGSNLVVKANNQSRTISGWATDIKAGPGNETQNYSFMLSADDTSLFTTQPSIDNNGTLTFTPSTNTGTTTVTVTLQDDAGESNGGENSFESTFIIETKATATPEISDINDQSMAQDTISDTVEFIVTDVDTAAESLNLSAISNNSSLIPADYVLFGGTGSSRTLSISPTTGESGVATLTVVVSDGINTASESFVVIVNAKPEAMIAVAETYSTTGTVPLSVQFTPTNIKNDITAWYWEFGDGTSSTDRTPLHTYVLSSEADISYYTVLLTVSGPGGSSTVTESSYITVNALKYVDFIATSRSGIYPLTVYFADMSVNIEGTREWDIDGDNISDYSDVLSLSHTYDSPGLYTVTLSVGSYEETKTAYVNVHGLTVTGRITNSVGAGVKDVMVDIHSSRNVLKGTAVTDSNGNYYILDLPSTTGLIVSAWPAYTMTQYLPQYFDGVETRANATRISTINGDLSTIDIVLADAPTDAITGRIVDGTTAGNPGMSGVIVEVYSNALDFFKSTVTDSNGNYTLTALKSGTDYVASVYDDRFNTEFFYHETKSNVTSRAEAARITPSDPPQTNVDIVIELENTITGHVIDDKGLPVSDIWVQAQDANDTFNTRSAQTDENGQYTLNGLDIDAYYYVEIMATAYPYQAYSLSTSRAMATQISIVEKNTNVDFVLATGADIRGRVTNNNNVMLNAVMIYAKSLKNGTQASTMTNEAGQYTLQNLPYATDYIIYADAGNYPLQYFNLSDSRTDAQYVSLASGNVNNVNFILDKGPVIHGNVRKGDSTTPAEHGVMVNVSSASTQFGKTVATDVNGVFEVIGLDENTTDYIISIWEPDYLPAFYNSEATNTTVYNIVDAQGIAPDTAYRNIVLKKGYSACGTVSAIDNSVVRSFTVEFWSSTTNGYAVTQVSGNTQSEATYCVHNILAGTYEVEVQSTNYADQTADNITINGNRSDVDFVLNLPSRAIGGTVNNIESGRQVQISACSDTLIIGKCKSVTVSGNGDVGYTIDGLKPASDYVLEMWSSSYPNQVYDGQINISNADRINVMTNNRSGVDFTLPDVVPEISGTVTFPLTSAVNGDSVAVQASSDNGSSGSTIVTFNGKANVTYHITGLSEISDYKVSVWSNKYKLQYFDNVFTSSKAMTVDTSDTIIDDQVNFVLTTGRQITGQIFKSDGTPVGAGIYVEAQSLGNVNAWTGASTEIDGTYLLGGLDIRSDYIVSAKKTDIPKAYYNSTGSVQTKALAETVSVLTGHADNISITIQTGFSIKGTVRDTYGRGLIGVWVSASSETKGVGSGIYSSVNGSYEIKGLPLSNDYVVKAIPQPGQSYIKQIKTGVTAGITGLDFILKQGFTLAGSVIAESTGIPITRANVILQSTNNNFYYKGGLNSNGQFEIGGLQSGADYVLTIKPDASVSYIKSTQELIIVSDRRNELIQLARSVQIVGKVQLADGSPVYNAWVSSFSSEAGNVNAYDFTDETGAFAITNIPDASDYVLTVQHSEYSTQKVDVTIGQNITVTMSTGGKISGQVRTESGPLSGGVVVELYSESLPLFRSVMTDSNGNFVFNSVPITKNGYIIEDYEVTVDGDTVGYPDKTKSGLKTGDSVTITLEKSLANEISGTVSDSDGTLMPANGGVTIEVYDSNFTYVKTVAVSSDGNATYKITGLQTGGTYWLVFRKSDGTAEYGQYQTSQIIAFQFSENLW